MSVRAISGVLAAACLSGLTGCGGLAGGIMADGDLYRFESKMQDVEFGMSKTRVQYIMGPPKQRLYEGNQEAWLWCQTANGPNLADAYITVYFFNAQAAGIHTYGNRAEGACENFFRRVEWLTDPLKSMAAKQRRRD